MSPFEAHPQEVVAAGVGDDAAARLREEAVRVAVGHRALVGVVLGLVGRDVVVGEPGSIRLQANEPAEAFPELRSEVRVRAEPDRHVRVASSVQRDVVRSRRAGAALRRIRRKAGRDPLLGSVPESRDRAGCTDTLELAANHLARRSRPSASRFGDVEAALGAEGEPAGIVEAAHDDDPGRVGSGSGAGEHADEGQQAQHEPQ